MKRLAILLSALLWLQTAASGAEPWFRYFSDGHAVIKQGSLYGFADRNGAEVIPLPVYQGLSFQRRHRHGAAGL